METVIITLRQLLSFAPRTIFIMYISISLTYILIKKGLLKYICKLCKPLTYHLNLPEETAAASAVAFGSALSANVMLAEFEKNNIITNKDTYLGGILNTISVTFKEIFTYLIPVIYPILGFKAGTIYFACFLSGGFVKYFFIYAYKKFKNNNHNYNQNKINNIDSNSDYNFSYKNQLHSFLKISIIYLSVSFVILFLLNSGFSGYFERAVEPITNILKLPSLLVAPVATYIFSPIAGASAIGLLITSQRINYLDGALAAITGSFLLLPFFALRGGLSRNISIFGPKTGFKITATSTGLAMFTRLVFIIMIVIYKGGIV